MPIAQRCSAVRAATRHPAPLRLAGHLLGERRPSAAAGGSSKSGVASRGRCIDAARAPLWATQCLVNTPPHLPFVDRRPTLWSRRGGSTPLLRNECLLPVQEVEDVTISVDTVQS